MGENLKNEIFYHMYLKIISRIRAISLSLLMTLLMPGCLNLHFATIDPVEGKVNRVRKENVYKGFGEILVDVRGEEGIFRTIQYGVPCPVFRTYNLEGNLLDKKQLYEYKTHPMVNGACISPDGNYLLFYYLEDKSFRILDLEQNTLKATIPTEKPVLPVEEMAWFSENEVAISTSSCFYLLDITSKKLDTLHKRMRDVKRLAASPNGKYIAYIERSDQGEVVWLYDTAVRERRVLVTIQKFSFGGMAWKPDGNTLCILEEEKDDTKQFILFSMETGSISTVSITELDESIWEFVFINKERVACLGVRLSKENDRDGPEKIIVINLQTGEVERSFNLSIVGELHFLGFEDLVFADGV